MRTKTLLLTAALSVASIAVATAQTVYSVNAVGYVKVDVAPGFALLANPLNLNNTNTLETVLTDAPNNTVAYLYNAGAFTQFTKRATGWTPAGNHTIDPGAGFFLKNVGTTTFTITFVGEVLQGAQTVSFGAGYNLLGSKIPQSGKVETDLKMTVAANDTIYTLKADGSYGSATKRATGWPAATPEPTVNVGSGFWLKAAAAGTWSRTFNVNQ